MADDRDLAHVSIEDYLKSHTKPNGGLRGFFRSNLFSALVIWILTQAVIVGGLLVSNYWKTVAVTEWKAKTDSRLDINEKQISENKSGIQDNKIKIEAMTQKIKDIEDDTKHLDVLESEHRRITKDVEELKAKK